MLIKIAISLLFNWNNVSIHYDYFCYYYKYIAGQKLNHVENFFLLCPQKVTRPSNFYYIYLKNQHKTW